MRYQDPFVSTGKVEAWDRSKMHDDLIGWTSWSRQLVQHKIIVELISRKKQFSKKSKSPFNGIFKAEGLGCC